MTHSAPPDPGRTPRASPRFARADIHRIKACLNGGRPSDEHPALPVSPTELAKAAADAVAAGAEAVHLHPRRVDGLESLHAADVAAAIVAIRAVCSVHIGVSTGLWISSGSVDDRYAQVSGWAGLDARERPDFASVNLSEPGYAALIELLHRTGIGVEVGVWSPADVDRLATVDGYLRILVEIVGPYAAAVGLPLGESGVPPAESGVPPGESVVPPAESVLPPGESGVPPAESGAPLGESGAPLDESGVPLGQLDDPAAHAVAAADAILARLDALTVPGPRLLHGEQAACWPLVRHAGRLGLPTRIGLEDTLTRSDGTPARDNAELVRQALSIWSASSMNS
jgi:uncharacterized protein (DUF849 family)